MIPWQDIRTAEEAREAAEIQVASIADGTASTGPWTQQGMDYAVRALDVAEDLSSGDAGSFWTALLPAWDGAGDAFPNGVLPGKWSDLRAIWESAQATYGSAMATEDAQSLRTQVAGGLAGSVQDAQAAASDAGGALVWMAEHPVATGLLALGAIILYQAAPVVLARLVTR